VNTALSQFAKRLEYSGLDRIVKDADLVVVAFSGGADSSLLLFLMNEYLKGSSVRVAACHLNHMIRGEEAYRDEDFAESFAEKLGVPFYLKRVDIPALSKGSGLEETARRERYAFFDEIASSHSPRTLIATAHNADDNLETVLFNLVRGTGLSGLCGIPIVRDDRYIRPLLSYSSAEIRSLADSLDIPYVVDSTNLSSDYSRNKIRHLVVPHLKELNPSAHLAALRMCEALREDEAYLDGKAVSCLAEYPDLRLPRETLRTLSPAVLSRVLMKMYAGDFDDARSLESVHLRDISRLLHERSDDFSVSVPSGVSFICADGTCFFGKKEEAASFGGSSEQLPFDTPLYKNGYVIVATTDKNGKYYPKDKNIYNLSIHKALKFDTINGKLEVRSRREGDLFRFGGMTRKVKKLFSEKKYTASKRERMPIICDDDGILWIPGFPVRDGVAADKGDDAVFLFCYREDDFEAYVNSENYGNGGRND